MLTPQELISGNGSHVYNLVFFNGCGSANNDNGIATAYANALGAKNYLGWDFPVDTTSAADAAFDFFKNLKRKAGDQSGSSITIARSGIQAVLAPMVMDGGLGQGNTALDAVAIDDSIIIDQTQNSDQVGS